jgi:hypothetical protein
VQARFDVPSPGGASQQGPDVLAQSRVVRVEDRPRGWGRVKVDRDAEALGGLKDRPEELSVEEMLERAAVDERALEAELPHRPHQLMRCGRRVRAWQRRECS